MARDYAAEYARRVERGREKAAREGRPFRAREAAGHKRTERNRDLENARKRIRNLPTYESEKAELRRLLPGVYAQVGRDGVNRLLDQKRENIKRYLSGRPVVFERLFDLPDVPNPRHRPVSFVDELRGSTTPYVNPFYWYHSIFG